MGYVILLWHSLSLPYKYRLLVIIWFLFREVSLSSECLGWAVLFYCGTPRAFHILFYESLFTCKYKTDQTKPSREKLHQRFPIMCHRDIFRPSRAAQAQQYVNRCSRNSNSFKILRVSLLPASF